MEKLGFIGLGHMGLPMARNLLKTGMEVYGLNRSKGAEQRFVEAGGRAGGSIAGLTREADVVMTCLPMPQDVEAVYLGDNGIVQHGREGQVLIDFSTVSPGVVRKVAAAAERKGMAFLDAPVSGGTVGAETATLSIMVGGKPEAFARVKPVLEALGQNIYHVGEVGSGTIVKLINQLMVGIHTQAASEALVLGQQLGVDSDTLFPILNASFAQSRILERHYVQYVAKGRFEAGFAIKLLHKDLSLVNQMADEQQVELALGRQALSLLSEASQTELAGKDMSAMFLYQQSKLLEANEG